MRIQGQGKSLKLELSASKLGISSYANRSSTNFEIVTASTTKIHVPRGLFSQDELRELTEPSTTLNRVIIGSYLGLGLVLVVYVMSPTSTSIAGTLVLFVSLPAIQYRLLHAAHESVHQDSHSRAKYALRNKIFLYWPLGLTPSFRQEHLAHHRHFGDPSRDPDASIYERTLDSRLNLVTFVLEGFLGIAALRQVLRRLNTAASESSKPRHFIELAIFHLILILMAVAVGHLFLYLAWVLSLSTIVKGFSQLRGLAEHGRQLQGPYVLRSFLDNSSFARFVGNTGFRHHAEHHLYPNVPFERLDLIRRRILRLGECSQDTRETIEFYNGNHFSILKLWCKPLLKATS